jgi:steroid delta-isomerase-like uncharacterized protein
MKRWISGLAIPIIALGLLATGCTCDTCEKCDEAAANKELVTRAMDVIVAGEFDRLDEYFAADYKRHSQASPIQEMTNLDQFRDWLAADRAAFPDGRLETDVMLAEGDKVALFGRWIAKQEGPMGPFPATGKTMTLQISGVHRIENGKIVETWVTWDNMSSLVQLGHMPPMTFEAPDKPAVAE